MSIVIPTRNGAATLAEQLDALVRATKPAGVIEVLVVNNGSTDTTAVVARSFADRLPVRIVDANERASINYARNTGVAAAIHHNILLCDADDRVDRGWLVAMAKAFAAGHRLVAGPIDYDLLNPRGVRAWRGSDRASVMTVLGFLPTGHGANLGFTRELWDVTGGFDETFIFAGDDVDFCWRAQLAGARLQEVPQALVHYRLRRTLADLFRQARAYGAAEVELSLRFEDRGLSRRSAAAPLREAWWILTRAPFALPRSRRGAWVRRLGQQVGRIEGAVRLRRLWW